VAATGFAHAAFGGWALAAGGVVLPVLGRLSPGRHADLRAQRILHAAAWSYLVLLRALGVMRLSVEGAERLEGGGGRLLVANHPTLLDMVMLCSVLPQADCIVNPSWADRFFLRGVATRARYLRNDGGLRVVRESVRRLDAGRVLVVFPEGTRSPLGGLGPFHRGAADIALASGCDPIPVAIRCDPPTLAKGQKWYDVPARPFHVSIEFRAAIPAGPSREGGVSIGIAARRLTAELREVFVKGLELGDVGSA
jgi:1-acyl-sn-glycerol-3-phosphate acyltransferase